MNRWNIPDWLEQEVRARDRACVYCGVRMLESAPSRGVRRDVATWEHIINDASIINRDNIVRCCTACNASKGSKSLRAWLESRYCARRGITPGTVAEVVKRALGASGASAKDKASIPA